MADFGATSRISNRELKDAVREVLGAYAAKVGISNRELKDDAVKRALSRKVSRVEHLK